LSFHRLVSSQTYWYMSYEPTLDAMLLSINGAVINEPDLQRSGTVWPGHQCSAYCMRHNEGHQITALKFNAAKLRTARYLH